MHHYVDLRRLFSSSLSFSLNIISKMLSTSSIASQKTSYLHSLSYIKINSKESYQALGNYLQILAIIYILGNYLQLSGKNTLFLTHYLEFQVCFQYQQEILFCNLILIYTLTCSNFFSNKISILCLQL